VEHGEKCLFVPRQRIQPSHWHVRGQQQNVCHGRKAVGFDRFPIESAGGGDIAHSAMLPPPTLAEVQKQYAPTNKFLSMFLAKQRAAFESTSHVVGNPVVLFSFCHSDQWFGDNPDVKSLGDSQPEVHVLARGQALIETANRIQGAATNHADGCFTYDVLG